MNFTKCILLCIGLKLINQAFPVGADYLVSIRIHNYSNPTNQCEQCSNNNNHCCDRQQSSGTCDECNTFFEYCVRNFNGNGQCLKSHQFVDPGRISLDFSQEFLLLRQNPIVFRGPTRTWEGVQIQVTAYDRDIDGNDDNQLQEVEVDLRVKDNQLGVETPPTTYTGPMGYSNITLSFHVTCAENWYGPYCDRFCQERDCMCDLPVPCHEDCLGVVCGENRHCVDGVDVYVCTCDDGFTGKWCEVNVDECEGVNCSGNGRCIDGVDSFYCDCDSGYSGILCEVANTEPLSTASKFQGSNTLYILVAGTIGWALLLTLGLAVLIAIVYTRLRGREKKKDSPQERPSMASQLASVQEQNCSNNTTPPFIMSTNRAFLAGENITINNEWLQHNLSYNRPIAPNRVVDENSDGQLSGSSGDTGRVGDYGNVFIDNVTYEDNGESHYEDIA